ncbi:unnamed protein product, partial [Trichogramma brassicae]
SLARPTLGTNYPLQLLRKEIYLRAMCAWNSYEYHTNQTSDIKGGKLYRAVIYYRASAKKEPAKETLLMDTCRKIYLDSDVEKSLNKSDENVVELSQPTSSEAEGASSKNNEVAKPISTSALPVFDPETKSSNNVPSKISSRAPLRQSPSLHSILHWIALVTRALRLCSRSNPRSPLDSSSKNTSGLRMTSDNKHDGSNKFKFT